MNIFSQFKKYFQDPPSTIVIPLLLVLFITCSWSLVIPGLGLGHDLNHQARIYDMATGLKQGNFPVIWSENLTFGLGMPLFEFYAPLPYFFGALFYILGFNLTVSVEAMIVIAQVATIIGSYFLGKELFKNTWAAVLVSAAISLAPYRAVDVYIRAALSEAWAIAFIPIVLLGAIKVINKNKYGWLILALSFSAVVLSHNLTGLLTVPFVAVFSLAYIVMYLPNWQKRITALLHLFLSGVLALGLSAFYFIPALIEKNFTKIDSFILSTYYDYKQHFLYIRQFLEPWGEWEYGGSGWGPNDEMSFFLGFGQLLIFALALLPFLLLFTKKKINKAIIFHTVLIFLTGAALLFTLLKTQPIWDMIEFSQYFQFPWRLLAVALVFAGLLAGSSFNFLHKRFQPTVFMIIFLTLIGFNYRYFQPEKYYTPSDNYQNFPEKIRSVNSANLFDYIPTAIKTEKINEFSLRLASDYNSLGYPFDSWYSRELSLLEPETIIDNSTKKVFRVNSADQSIARLHLAYYPGWQTKIDSRYVDTQADELGLISFELPAGEHTIEVQLDDTPIRYWSKIISLAAVVVTLVLIMYQNKKLLFLRRS